MKLVFMGTPVFALSCLEQLIAAGHEVAAVFTQPDKPKNRGKQIQMTPVKECALKHDIPVYQPLSLRKGEDAEKSLEVLKEINPQCIVVVAYGQILPESILELPEYGCINVHASLLPKYRGAAPIHYVILNGETKSGVTIMQMDIGMDTGDMLAKAEVEITPEMTMGELHDSLKEIGGKLLLETVEKIKRGEITPVKQNDAEATYAHLLTRDMEAIDWNLPAAEIHNKIRAFNPAPGAFTNLPGGKKLKIWRAEVASGSGTKAGEVTEVLKNGFKVACGSGALLVTEVQPESKKLLRCSAMAAALIKVIF